MRWLALIVLLALPGVATAQGSGGDPADRLDAHGAPTDRYLDRVEIRDVLHGGTEAFFACFREHLRGDANPGDLSAVFFIERDGVPSRVTIDGPETPEALSGCLVEAVAALRFDDHDGDPMEVSYPIVYQSTARQGARVVPYPLVFIRASAPRLPLLSLPPDLSAGEIVLLEKVLVVEEDPEEEPDGEGEPDGP